MFVTPSDFDGIRYNLPRLEQVANSIQQFFDEEEKMILEKLLGVALCDEVYLALIEMPIEWVASPTGYSNLDRVVYGNEIWVSTIDGNIDTPGVGSSWTSEGVNKYLLLKNGTTFTDNGHQYKWGGFKKMLIPYLYFKYIEQDANKYSGIGAVVAKSENSMVVPTTTILVKAWNEFVQLSGQHRSRYHVSKLNSSLMHYLTVSISDFPAYTPCNSYALVNEFDV